MDKIVVNGVECDSWQEVPADLREAIDSWLADRDGPTRTATRSTHYEILGVRYESLEDMPAELRAPGAVVAPAVRTSGQVTTRCRVDFAQEGTAGNDSCTRRPATGAGLATDAWPGQGRPPTAGTGRTGRYRGVHLPGED